MATTPPPFKTRKKLAAQGKALPEKADTTSSGGRFPIRNAADLTKAIQAVGRAKPEDRDSVKRFIVKRAKALGLESKIPSSWTSSSK